MTAFISYFSYLFVLGKLHVEPFIVLSGQENQVLDCTVSLTVWMSWSIWKPDEFSDVTGGLQLVESQEKACFDVKCMRPWKLPLCLPLISFLFFCLAFACLFFHLWCYFSSNEFLPLYCFFSSGSVWIWESSCSKDSFFCQTWISDTFEVSH